MKNFFILTTVLFIIALSFTSCEKDSTLVINNDPQIVDNDHPLPAGLSENTYKLWVTKESLLSAKEINFACEQSYNEYSGEWNNYNCGMWRTIKSQLYYGTSFGVRYISADLITVVLNQEEYYRGRDLVEKIGTIMGSFSNDSNPVGINAMKLNYFEGFK